MSRRFQGGQSSERLTLTTVKNNDYLQVYHDAGGSEDSDKGLPFGIVQAQPVATCSTAAGTVAKVANIIASVSQPDFTLLNGRIVTIKMANGNTATDPTLNVNSTGALPIRLPNQASSVHVGPNCWGAGVWLQFQYVTDGSNQYWLLLGHDVASATSEYTTYSDGRIEYLKSYLDTILQAWKNGTSGYLVLNGITINYGVKTSSGDSSIFFDKGFSNTNYFLFSCTNNLLSPAMTGGNRFVGGFGNSGYPNTSIKYLAIGY